MKQKQNWALIVLLGILTALAPLSTDMYLPALPELAGEFGIHASLTQLTLTMTTLGMAAGQLTGGPVSDKMGRRAPLLLGMAIFTAASTACFLASDIDHFLCFRFLQGFFGAFGIVIARAIARDVTEGPELMRYFAILMMVNGLAPILAPVAGGQILNFTTWRGIFAVLAVIGAALVLATFVFKETLPREKRNAGFFASFESFPMLLHDNYFRGHCLLQCFVFGAFFAYIAGSSFLFQNVYGVSAQTYSFIFGGIGVGLLLSGAMPARLAGTVPEIMMLRWSLLIPLAGSTALLAGFLCGAPIWYTVPVLFVTIIPLSVFGAASVSLALSKQGRVSGGASALLGFFSMILGAAAMPLAGVMGDASAIPMGVLMLAGYAAAYVTFQKAIVPQHKKITRSA